MAEFGNVGECFAQTNPNEPKADFALLGEHIFAFLINHKQKK